MKWQSFFVMVILLVATPTLSGISQEHKVTDTIFYNRGWQLCERPVAACYRIGTLVVDSLWYYTGKFKDYAMDGRIIEEGEYNQAGERDGEFRFYFPDGKLKIVGRFWKSLMIGDWKWYYSNDSLRSVINFDGPSDDFKFVTHKLPDGKVLLNQSTGNFEWHTDIYNTGLPSYKVYGAFNEGKRSGSWRYYSVDRGAESFEFSEKYDKDGKFTRGTVKASLSADNPKSRFADYVFVPPTLWATEQMQYDSYFQRGDSSGGVALLNYLVNRTSAEIIVKNPRIETALSSIIRSLENESSRVDYLKKEINGKIEFKIGEKGFPEELSVSGTGLTEKERELFTFVVSKFRQIGMDYPDSAVMESKHTIHFFSVNMQEFVPNSLKARVGPELFFTTLTKEKFLVLVASQKNRIKRFARDSYRYYW